MLPKALSFPSASRFHSLSNCAIGCPTALSVVRLLLHPLDRRSTYLLHRIKNRMVLSPHLVIVRERGQAGVLYIGTSPSCAQQLACFHGLSIVRVSAIIKRWSCLAMDSCRVGPRSWSLAPYDSGMRTGEILHFETFIIHRGSEFHH